jgi:HEPN domain-containing protein
MVDIDKQIAHWRAGALEDWEVAIELVDLERTRHGLFFAHLALEKLLKAHVCRTTRDLAPRLHSLLRLAERTDLTLSEAQTVFLARFDRYQIEGRYPELLAVAPDMETARAELGQAKEVFEWLNQRLLRPCRTTCAPYADKACG